MDRLRPTVLLVDDEPDALELVGFNLKKAGMDVVTAETGPEALAKAQAVVPDLVVLDVMLPVMDGLEVCRKLRRDSKTAAIPVVMLTAKGAELDRILGLELGADDYVTKPFSPRELVLRVKKLLQRGKADEEKDLLHFDDLVIDVTRHEVLVNGTPVALTLTEFRLLTLLAQRSGRVQSREQLLNDVWDYHSPIDTRTVDTHVRRLREKIGPAARHLDTVRGVGYRFVP
jgi:DNA-binding response OmpR family regulator